MKFVRDKAHCKHESYTKTDIDNKLGTKANASDVYTKGETYTKTEVNNLVNVKANSSNVYTKSETYTKTEVNNLVNAKANSSDVYTKGNYAILTGTTSTSVNNSINYPSGFTMDNSVVISKALNMNGWQDNISTGSATEISNFFQVILASSKIVLSNYTGQAYNYKIVLMKIS